MVANKPQPKVGIIVLNWNNYPDTAKCLESIKSNVRYNNYRVYVVDNGSEDGSGERIDREYDWCEVIYNDENLGFAAGNNLGIRQAIADGADYVLLLNNDIVVSLGFLRPLVKSAESGGRVAITSGVVRDAGTGEVHSAGMEFSMRFLRSNQITDVPREMEYPVEFVSGAMMLLSRRFLLAEGMLDESYFFALEDMELSYRARDNGWRILVNPDSEVYHKVSASSGSGNAFRYYHNTRNRLQFAEDILPPHDMAIFYAFFVVTRIVRFVQWIFEGRTSLIEAVVAGALDHVLDRDFRKP